MEPAGLAVGLAGLCLDAVEKVDSYRDSKRDSRTLNARFQTEKIRFQEWGRKVGIEQDSPDGGSFTHPALDDPDKHAVVEELLSLIREARELGGDDGVTTKRRKMAWVFREKKRRTEKVNAFADSVKSLHDLVPIETLGSTGPEESRQPQDDIVDLKEWIGELRQTLSKLEREREAETRRDFFDWLGLDPSSDSYDMASEQRLDGTCEWVLDHSVFRQWSSVESPNSASKQLWIHGPAGFGKTVLCARIIQHMKQTMNSPVAYFFFSSESGGRDDPYTAIRAWLAQLVIEHASAFEAAYIMWLDQNSKRATRTTTVKVLRAIAQLGLGCAFVLDGLDECNWVTGSSMTESVTGFLKSVSEALHGSNSRLLVVSRDEPEIRGATDTGNGWIHTGITPANVEEDVLAYSSSIVDRKLGSKNETLRHELSMRMADRCGGQFLWLKMQEDGLRGWKNEKSLRETIEETPSGMDQLYSRNVERILRRPDPEKTRALRLLRWIAFAQWPLFVSQLAEAIVIDQKLDDLPTTELPDVVDQEYIDIEILGLCGSLIEVRPDRRGGFSGRSTVHLTHFSIKEFFAKNPHVLSGSPWSHVQGDGAKTVDETMTLARLCLRYVNYPYAWARNPVHDDTHRLGSLTAYAASSFFGHLPHRETNDPEFLKLLDRFFDSENPQWKAWKAWIEAPRNGALPVMKYAPGRYTNQDKTPLFYAASLRLVHTVKRLLAEQGPHSTATLSLAMHEAAVNGQVDILLLILDAGSDLSASLHGEGGVLMTAASHGELDVVKMLVNFTAYPASEVTMDPYPMRAAAASGHLHVVKFLLEQGVDPNISDPEGYIPIVFAIAIGCLPMIEILVEHGSDFEAERRGQTPLMLAAYFGHSDIVEYLCEKGVKVNQGSMSGSLPIASAVEGGDIAVMKTLVGLGVNLNAMIPMFGGRSLLMLAANFGHVHVLEYLLSEGGNVNLTNKYGLSAAHVAAELGHTAILRRLLQEGCQFDLMTTDGYTPFLKACIGGHLECVVALMEAGADLCACGAEGLSPLTGAANAGRHKIVKYLLRKGADVNSIDGRGSTALQQAAASGQSKVVRLLLRRGADASLVHDSFGWTAAFWAAINGHQRVLAQLLTPGNTEAANLLDRQGHNALHFAVFAYFQKAQQQCALREGETDTPSSGGDNNNEPSQSGPDKLIVSTRASIGRRLRVIRFLLRCGTDMAVENIEEWSPVGWAAQHGLLDVVALMVPTKGESDAISKKGVWHPLHVAARWGQASIVSYLLGLGVDASTLSHDRTPLQFAAAEGHGNVVELLLRSAPNLLHNLGKARVSALHIAAREGHEKVAEILIRHGADINMMEPSWGLTPYLYAMRRGHMAVVRLLEQEGGETDFTSSAFSVALHRACGDGFTDVVRHLLNQNGVQVNGVDDDGEGWTPLHEAAWEGHVECARLLLGAGADASRTNAQKATPLQFAAGRGWLEMVRLLLHEVDGDVNIDRARRLRRDALFQAAYGGHVEVLSFLLDGIGADLNAVSVGGVTPLMCAASEGHLSAISYLIDEADADVDETNDAGFSAVHVAAFHGHHLAVQRLVDKGAHISTPAVANGNLLTVQASLSGDMDTLRLALDLAGSDINTPHQSDQPTPLWSAAFGGKLDAVKLMVEEHGGDVVGAEYPGGGALHAAAGGGHVDVCEYLLDQGADLSLPSPWGQTPLASAAVEGHSKAVELLLRRGASAAATTTKESMTPLHLAARCGHDETVAVLLAHGADATARSDSGLTPLHFTCFLGDLQTVQLLLDGGADVMATDENDVSPIELAARLGQCDVCRLLLEHSTDPAHQPCPPLRHALSMARAEGHGTCVELLLEYGAGVEETMSHDVASLPVFRGTIGWGSKGIARLFLRHRPRAPLHALVVYGHAAVVVLLHERNDTAGQKRKRLRKHTRQSEAILASALNVFYQAASRMRYLSWGGSLRWSYESTL